MGSTHQLHKNQKSLIFQKAQKKLLYRLLFSIQQAGGNLKNGSFTGF
jgi:hypothetical protein